MRSIRGLPTRRDLLPATATIAAAAGFGPLSAGAATRPVAFNRTAYNRYVALMNAGDLRFAEYYDDDIKFVMQIRGKANVLHFYGRQMPFVKETLQVLFFCSDATGAAAEVRSEMRCVKDCDDPAIFGRILKTGEVQRAHGFLIYVLNAQGKITEIKAPPPDILEPWHREGA